MWQDYWGHDEIVLDSSYTNVHYPAAEIDLPLVYNGTVLVSYKKAGSSLPPTPRDMMRNYNGLVSVTYANDLLAQQLGYASNPLWVETASGSVGIRCGAASSPVAAPSPPVAAPSPPVAAPSPPVAATSPVSAPSPVAASSSVTAQTCTPKFGACSVGSDCCSGNCRTNTRTNTKKCGNPSRRLNGPNGGGPPSFAGHGRPPSFASPVARTRWAELVESMPNSKAAEILSILAEEDCIARGNPKSASESWIQMMGMGSTPEVFECHLY
jgi:hypothetical protein